MGWGEKNGLLVVRRVMDVELKHIITCIVTYGIEIHFCLQ